ncbi:MAG: DUF2147 domain-containing protein [Pseudomonadota bacterium]
MNTHSMHAGPRKALPALALAMAIGTVALPSAALADGALGIWKTAVKEDGRFLHVDVQPCDGGAVTLCGTVVGAFGGASESSIGRQILWDMEPDGENAWADGKVWAPDDDKTYSGKMELKGGGTLELSGCVLGGLICRGQDWTRVD